MSKKMRKILTKYFLGDIFVLQDTDKETQKNKEKCVKTYEEQNFTRKGVEKWRN